MRSTFKVLFYVKKGSEKPNGNLPLMCRITVDGEIKQFSCKMDVSPHLWDVKNNRASGKSVEAQRINHAVDKIRVEVKRRYQELMPMINFPRERLGFKDDIIRKLCAFKDVSITGKLHSFEFNRDFETQRAVCSIKEDNNGKFDFKIDGVSHVSWFRKNMNEFKESIGIPKPRQNRGMQL